MHLICDAGNLPKQQKISNNQFCQNGASRLRRDQHNGKMEKLPNRIRELRKGKRLSLERLAEASGLSITYLQRIETGERRLKTDALIAIAKALDVSVSEVLSESEPIPPPHTAVGNSQVRIMLIGEVAAGVWREANSDAFDPTPINIAHDGRFPIAALFALRVRGSSINRQAPDGSLILCLDIFHAPRKPTNGDWVVARRTRNGFAEMTVKKFTVIDEETVLAPDSTDPNHQEPIRVGEHDGDEVSIVAFVLDFIRQATRL